MQALHFETEVSEMNVDVHCIDFFVSFIHGPVTFRHHFAYVCIDVENCSHLNLFIKMAIYATAFGWNVHRAPNPLYILYL